MAYVVIAEKFSGRHKAYMKGETVPEMEIPGGEAGRKLALEGQKNAKRKKGNVEVSLKDVPAKLKIVNDSKKKVAK